MVKFREFYNSRIVTKSNSFSVIIDYESYKTKFELKSLKRLWQPAAGKGRNAAPHCRKLEPQALPSGTEAQLLPSGGRALAPSAQRIFLKLPRRGPQTHI
jgi:hypothetical protein